MSALITCGHTRQSLSATRALGRFHIPVAVGTIKKPSLATCSHYASSTFITPDPKIKPKEFVKTVAEQMIGRYAPCALVSTDDAWWALSKFRMELPLSAQKILPPHISVVRALDHEALHHFAQSLLIPTAPMIHFKPQSSFDEVESKIKHVKFPILIRPIVSWIEREDGERQADKKFVVQNKDHLFSILKNYIYFQQYGFLLCTYQSKKSVAFFGVAHEGKPLAYGFQERLKEEKLYNEVASIAKTIKPILKIKKYSLALLSFLNWQGPFKIEFIADENNEYYLVSIIGRLWASLELSIKAGLNVPLITYELAQDKIDNKILKNANENIMLCWLLGGGFTLPLFRKQKVYFDVFDVKDPLPFLFELKERFHTRY